MNKFFLLITLIILINSLVLAGCVTEEPVEEKESEEPIEEQPQEILEEEEPETPKELPKGVTTTTVQIAQPSFIRNQLYRYDLGNGVLCYILPGQADDVACVRK